MFSSDLPEGYKNWVNFYDSILYNVPSETLNDPNAIISNAPSSGKIQQFHLRQIKEFALQELMDARFEVCEVIEFNNVALQTIHCARAEVFNVMWGKIKDSLFKTAKR